MGQQAAEQILGKGVHRVAFRVDPNTQTTARTT